MAFERWGALSVKDHTDPSILVPNVLLYDRLILPFPSTDEEEKRWAKKGWHPELLRKRLKTLGPLAIKKPWDEKRMQVFKKRVAEIKAFREDASDAVKEVQQALAYQLTRRILAQEPVKNLPKDVTRADVVAAYESEQDLHADFKLEYKKDDVALLGLLFAQKLAMPENLEGDVALARAVKLSKDPRFRENRQALYDWQWKVLNQHKTPEEAVEAMSKLVEKYNERIEKAMGKVYLKYAFTVCAVVLGLAGAALGSPLASASAILTLVRFATLDGKPVIEAGEAAPAAMFHDVENRVGVKFK
jgi:hypothetical protein